MGFSAFTAKTIPSGDLVEFANNGAAIANGVLVPKTEAIVLVALGKMGKPSTVPEIATALEGRQSEASIYTLLARLNKRGGLVERENVEIKVHGTRLKRVLWTSLLAQDTPADPSDDAAPAHPTIAGTSISV